MSRERELLNKALAVLLELKDCSDSWCEYYVPIGIHYRIDEAIQELLAQPEQTEKEPEAWMLIDKETGARIPKAYKPEHGVNKDRWELYPLFASPPKQPESTAEAIMPNGVCISNVYAAYEEGRKSVMSEQEPVAWIIETEIHGKLSEWVCTDKKHYMEAHDGTKDPIPLYPEPPKRTPLSNEEIDKGLNGKNGFENWYDDRFVDGVRFAEKHHGIGGGE